MGYVITIKEPIKELDMFPERKGKIHFKLIHLNKMLFTENISRHGLGMILGNTYVVVVFPQAPFRATNVPRPTLVSSNCATAPWLSEEGRR